MVNLLWFVAYGEIVYVMKISVDMLKRLAGRFCARLIGRSTVPRWLLARWLLLGRLWRPRVLLSSKASCCGGKLPVSLWLLFIQSAVSAPWGYLLLSGLLVDKFCHLYNSVFDNSSTGLVPTHDPHGDQHPVNVSGISSKKLKAKDGRPQRERRWTNLFKATLVTALCYNVWKLAGAP